MNDTQKTNSIKQKLFGETINKATLWIVFCLYLFLLIWVIALKFNADWLPALGKEMRALPIEKRVVLIPFQTFISNGFYFHLDYFLNVIIYIPMGLILPLTMRKNQGGWCLLIIILSSAIFEVEQLFTGFGGCDTADLICNVVGGVIGLAIFYLLRKKTSDKTINIITFIIIIIATPIALYALINTIIHWQYYVIA